MFSDSNLSVIKPDFEIVHRPDYSPSASKIDGFSYDSAATRIYMETRSMRLSLVIELLYVSGRFLVEGEPKIFFLVPNQDTLKLHCLQSSKDKGPNDYFNSHTIVL